MAPRKTRAAQKAEAESHPADLPEASTSRQAELPATETTTSATSSSKAKGKSRAARHQPLVSEAKSAIPASSVEVDGSAEQTQHQHEPVGSESQSSSSSTSKPTLQDRLAKLAELRAKMSASTKANRKDILSEQSRSRSIAAELKKSGSSRKLQKAEKVLEERDLRESGEDVERYRNMLYSVEDSERWDAKLDEKDQRRDQGQIDFQDLAERAYQRKIKQMKPDLASYSKQKDEIATLHSSSSATTTALTRRGRNQGGQLIKSQNEFGELDTIHYGSHKPSDDAIDRVVSHLNQEQQVIKNRSRRREDDPDAEVTYINDKNKHFNKKLKRFYDNQTREIRENLERGTAL